MLSFDGVRHDDLDRGGLPALERVMREGVRADALVPVFPSSTFPNHAALATGATAERHGIVGNRFLDPELGLFDYGADPRFLRAEPLWVTAERQGLRAAVFFWVLSERDWRGRGATYRKAPFDSGVDETTKVTQILAWLDLPPAERPRLILSWWHGADHAGHRHGPGSEEAQAQLRGQDEALGRLLAGLDARDAWSHTTLVVVSDHGMTAVAEAVDAQAPLDAAGLGARVVLGGPVAHVHLEEPARRKEAAARLAALPGVAAWPSDAVPERLRYRLDGRTGDVVALAEPPRVFVRGLADRLRRALAGGAGGHGYDPTRHSDMHGILLARGRGAAPGTRLPPQRAVDVAPTVARLLGIEPPRHAEGRPIEALRPPGAGPVAGRRSGTE